MQVSANTPPLRVKDNIGLQQIGSVVGFFGVHVACFAAIWTGVGLRDLLICFVLYFVRMFAVTGGYHRYFSHRTYKMGRITQFLMAFLAQMSAQKGVLWWASVHRHHHKFSDQPEDAHSPRQDGFWASHVGWILSSRFERTDPKRIQDLMKFPELRWLNGQVLMPPFLLGFLSWFFFGWSGLVVGFFWSTVLLWHGTFTINSLAHVIGTQRYATGDDSRNHWFLALITLGEGWHNNHHHYHASCRQGFYWWEIDVTYWILRAMAAVGLVWDIKEPPRAIVEGRERRPVEAPVLASAG